MKNPLCLERSFKTVVMGVGVMARGNFTGPNRLKSQARVDHCYALELLDTTTKNSPTFDYRALLDIIVPPLTEYRQTNP